MTKSSFTKRKIGEQNVKGRSNHSVLMLIGIDGRISLSTSENTINEHHHAKDDSSIAKFQPPDQLYSFSTQRVRFWDTTLVLNAVNVVTIIRFPSNLESANELQALSVNKKTI